jgi:PAS domain-containing protein
LGGAQQLFALSFVAGVVLSVGLLVARLFRPTPPALRVPTRIMLFGVAFGFGPMILFFLLPVLAPQLFLDSPQLGPWMIGISALTIPILPLAYLRAIFQHHLGALEFRANRLLGVYGIVSLYITGYAAALLVGGRLWRGMEGPQLAVGLAFLLLLVAVAPTVRARFQKLIDRHVFGIRHSPDQVIQMVAAAIPTAFNRTVLAEEIVGEVLPTLLIRQSALYVFGESGTETLYEQGLPGDPSTPSEPQLAAWLRRAGRYIPPDAAIADCPWLRLVIPLGFQAETVGAWLFGRRDPDDFYPQSDVTLLTTVANQVTPALENIRLYERAQEEIAQRRAAEEEIRASEERYRNLFEATLEGIAVVRQGTILEVNQALLGILGYSTPELIGQSLSSFVATGAEELGVDATEGIGLLRDGTSVNLEVAATCCSSGESGRTWSTRVGFPRRFAS